MFVKISNFRLLVFIFSHGKSMINHRSILREYSLPTTFYPERGISFAVPIFSPHESELQVTASSKYFIDNLLLIFHGNDLNTQNVHTIETFILHGNNLLHFPFSCSLLCWLWQHELSFLLWNPITVAFTHLLFWSTTRTSTFFSTSDWVDVAILIL